MTRRLLLGVIGMMTLILGCAPTLPKESVPMTPQTQPALVRVRLDRGISTRAYNQVRGSAQGFSPFTFATPAFSTERGHVAIEGYGSEG